MRTILVVGGGPAAHRVTASLARAIDAGATATDPLRVVVVSEEPRLPYDRVALTSALGADVDLTLGDTALWERPDVDLLTGERVVAIDPAARTVTTDLQVLAYDELVLATGSSAARLPIPGAEHSHVYRSLDDIEALVATTADLRARLGRAPQAVVIGGGLLGLEAAAGLDALGCRSTLLQRADWLMNAQVDQGGGEALGRLVDAKGLLTITGADTRALHADADGHPTGVELGSGHVLPADIVVTAIGVRPRDELAAAAGLPLGPRGGVVIDATCATGTDHVWAIGEVACFEGQCVGLVAPANAMADVVADRLTGGTSTFGGFDTAAKLKLAGVDVASFGDAFATTPGALEVVYADPARGLYQKLVVADDGVTLLGGVLVGDAAAYSSLRPLVGTALPADAAAFLSVAGGEGMPETDLPDDAVLCSCNNVSAGTVRDAVLGVDGPACHDLAALKACTRAGTSCGSCVPLVKKTLDRTMAAAGLEVSSTLCEHVAMSRAQLFEGVRALDLHSFDEVMARFGHGLGCDVCKPTIASILATLHEDYLLDQGRGALQDTNDRALANMQKDGTYSVVPRIPAGEITPEGLVVIAEVARDYGLYTKITGAQRIDLFGARLDQLPDIWKRLVDAGFESGHAYGKSLRTVKSCVGSTWCRYGVQDSVAMAIRLELRYRGLRSPHKLKFGVSGCGRECAEAQGKDVGLIASDKGWNLWVGGNGGAQPRHAQLLAQDLDDEALVGAIDRYLMYYIRTADRLQRTARWMDDLEGGIDHVHAVVMEDSLGIGAELEAAMERHVEHYRDEWAATLEDPDRLRRFRSFVNAPIEPDDGPSYVTERGQRRPATAAERAGDLGPGVTPWTPSDPAPVLLGIPQVR
ncbi:assimilatory nitrite reductase (NAD(P)H) large subunit precursor [Raineyella antarctica]|uniref:assimilatory sulfite reductase (ferredoxin) n=1 Tax=Raineyella antarctica TaxID=1577474 RepID=A0A1G6GG27_9ACTN|nr:nitrite reductase large subunit NirB [Raineyella antarctica]SDB80849.1 assimilatory nitrite reductase (NAD(P)H) large subunit precursor [Raineyella antarctica]